MILAAAPVTLGDVVLLAALAVVCLAGLLWWTRYTERRARAGRPVRYDRHPHMEAMDVLDARAVEVVCRLGHHHRSAYEATSCNITTTGAAR